MKDNEKLLDAIGEANEIYVPDMAENSNEKPIKTVSKARRIAVASGACAAALVGAIAINGVINNNVPTTDNQSSQSAQEHISYSESSDTESENSVIEQSSPDTSNREPLTDEELSQLVEEHRIYPQISDIKSENTELSPFASDIIFGSMGFEGYMVNDISELDTINPWSADIELESLPVYKNLSIKENCSLAVYLTQEEMEEMANDAACCLGIEVKSTTVERISDIAYQPPEDVADLPYCVEAVCDGEKYGTDAVNIRVFGDGQMSVDFGFKEMALPDEYNFTYHETTDEQAIEVMEYFAEEFKALLQFENPAVYSYADRTIYGTENRSYYIYDKCEDYKQDILSYNFTSVKFCPGDKHNLMIIHFNNPLAAAENLGEYPIIDAKAATQLLLNGSYISTVPTEYLINGEITADAIAKTELVYRMGERDEYYQPYYKFYVELSDEYYAEDSRPEGMKEYGGFYVPAVESEYLSDISVWDGSFN